MQVEIHIDLKDDRTFRYYLVMVDVSLVSIDRRQVERLFENEHLKFLRRDRFEWSNSTVFKVVE